MPATKLAMEAALEHPELAEAFLKRYAPGVLLRVHVKLDERASPGASTRRVGSSAVAEIVSAGRRLRASQPLKTGTMCQAAIVVEKRRLINLILPWTKTAVGSD